MDSAGRLVMKQSRKQTLDKTNIIPIELDLQRAVVIDNSVQAQLLREDGTVQGAAAAFISTPPDDGWSDYPVIIWQDQTPARLQGLRQLGITAGRVLGSRGPLSVPDVQQRVALLTKANSRIYIENIATDFYAAYHRYHPDHPVTWAFDQVRALAGRDPSNPAVFQRQPSLSDPVDLTTIATRLRQHVQLFGPYRPLYYSLGDETGLADLAAAWDFDLGPASLAAWRAWLQTRYGTISRLNAQWGSNFVDWHAVAPTTTSAAIQGPADNFSAWADFKEGMDAAFASAVQAGTDAVHAADPAALAAIEGAQIPGWGGYDYSKLASTVDVMELYDAGNNVEIVRALNPRLIEIATAFAGDPNQVPSLWHQVFLGSRGLIVWDEANALVDDAGRPSALGQSSAAIFAALRDGPAAEIGASTPLFDPVAILYSPASFRVQWLLDRRADGGNWMARNSEIEGGDSPLRTSMRQAASWLIHRGLQPRWITEETLAASLSSGTRVLLLPQTSALSDDAIAQIRGFVQNGGTVLADGIPGLYDAHGRRRATPPLQDVVVPITNWSADNGAAEHLHKAGVSPLVALTTPDGGAVHDIDVRLLRNGAVTLIALQRDAGAPGGDTEDIVLSLAQPYETYDLLRHTKLGSTSRIPLPVGRFAPALLAIAPVALTSPTLHGPAIARLGDTIDLQVALAFPTPANAEIVQVDVIDPHGHRAKAYSGAVTLRDAPISWSVPLALNDLSGQWTVRAVDRLSGASAFWNIKVTPDQ
jgi:hypothetical protein